jgi:hypothetical protein
VAAVLGRLRHDRVGLHGDGRDLGEQDRRVVLQRPLGTDDDRQRVEIHDHRFRVLRLGERLGHDHRCGLTDVSDDVVREDRTRKRSPDVAGWRLRLQLQVGGRQRGDDARRPDGLRDIQRIHAGMRHHGADEHGAEPALDRQVVDVPAATRQEPRVLGAVDHAAEDRTRHRPATVEGDMGCDERDPCRRSAS